MSDKKPNVRDFVKNAFAATTEKAAGPAGGAYGLSGQAHIGAPQISGAGRAGSTRLFGASAPGMLSLNPVLSRMTGNTGAFGAGPGTPSVAAVGGSAPASSTARPDLANYGAVINAKNHPTSPGAAPVTLPKPGSAEAWGVAPKPPLNMGVYGNTPSHTAPSMAAKPASPAGAMPSVPAAPPIPPVPKPAAPEAMTPPVPTEAELDRILGPAAKPTAKPATPQSTLSVVEPGHPDANLFGAAGDTATAVAPPDDADNGMFTEYPSPGGISNQPLSQGIAGITPSAARTATSGAASHTSPIDAELAQLQVSLESVADAGQPADRAAAENAAAQRFRDRSKGPSLADRYVELHPEVKDFFNSRIQPVAGLSADVLRELRNTAAPFKPPVATEPGQPGYQAAKPQTPPPPPPPATPATPEQAYASAASRFGGDNLQGPPTDWGTYARQQMNGPATDEVSSRTPPPPPPPATPATPEQAYASAASRFGGINLQGSPPPDWGTYLRQQMSGPPHDAISPATPPTYQQPTYQQPTYQQPTYQQPTYQQPTYRQQGFHPFRGMFGKRGSYASPTGLLGYFGKTAELPKMLDPSPPLKAVGTALFGGDPAATAAPRNILEPSPTLKAIGNAIFNRDPGITMSLPQREPTSAPPVVADAPPVAPKPPGALKPGEPGYPAMPPPTMPGPAIGTGNPPLSHGGVRPLSEPVPGHPVDSHGGQPQPAGQPAGQPQPAQAAPPMSPEAMDAKLQGIRADVEAGKPPEQAHKEFGELAQQYKTTFPEQKQLVAKVMSGGQLDAGEITSLLNHTAGGQELGAKAEGEGFDPLGFIQKTWASASPAQRVMLISGLSLGLISVGSMLFGGPGAGNIGGLLGSLGLLAGGAGLFDGLLGGGAKDKGAAPAPGAPTPGAPNPGMTVVPAAGAAGQAASAYAREGGQQKQPAAGEPPGQPSGVAGGGAAAPPANKVNAPQIQAAFSSPGGLENVDSAAMPAMLAEWSQLGQPQRLQLIQQLRSQNPAQFNTLRGKLQFAADSTPNSWLVSDEQRRMAQQLLPTVNAAVGS